MLKITEQQPGLYAFDHVNGMRLGQAQREEDGFYYFYFSPAPGAWSAHHLHAIGNELDKLNKDWDDKIQQYFSEKGDQEVSSSVDPLFNNSVL